MDKNNYTNKDLNILPKRLGHLTFLEKINIKQNEWRYKVKCDCGYEFIAGKKVLQSKYMACRSCTMKEVFKSSQSLARKKDNIYEEKNGYILINNKVKIDKGDLTLIQSYNKYVAVNSSGYALMWVNGREMFIHRLVLGLPQEYNPEDGLIGEHKNGDRADCRKTNLRICKKSNNPINCKKYKNNSTGHKGVYWHKKNKKWIACIFYNKQRLYLGSFEEYDAAVQARENAELQYFGEYRRDKKYE